MVSKPYNMTSLIHDVYIIYSLFSKINHLEVYLAPVKKNTLPKITILITISKMKLRILLSEIKIRVFDVVF